MYSSGTIPTIVTDVQSTLITTGLKHNRR